MTVNITNPKLSDYGGPCPRCEGLVSNEHYKGQFSGALSRLDNETYICSACGTDEGMFQFLNRGTSLPPFGHRVVL